MSFPAAVAGVIAELAVAAFLGFALLRPVLDRLSAPEKFAWAIGAGTLIEIAAGLISSLIGGPDPVWLIAAGAALALTISRPGAPAARPASGRPGRIDLFLLALGAAGLIAFLLVAISEPLWANDYLAIWGLKAKMIAVAHALPRDLASDPAYGYAHPEYPLGLPLALASLAWRRWNDHALAVVFPWFAAAFVAAIGGFAWRRSTWRGAAVAAALAGLYFPLLAASNVGLADIPFALAAVLVGAAFLDLAEPGRGAVARLAIAILLAALLKREGLLLAAVFAAAAGFGSLDRRRKRLAVIAVFVPAAAAAAAHRFFFGGLQDRDFRGAASLALAPGELAARFWRVARTAASEMPASAAIGLAAIIVFLLVAPRVGEDRVIPPIAALVAIYAGACAFYAGDPAFLVHTALPRIVSAVLPALGLAVGPRAAALFRNSRALG